jgi:phage repressor protein C with HTH and peptisase S24 domain
VLNPLVVGNIPHMPDATGDWRQRFIDLMTTKGFTMKSLSLAAGKGETFVRDMLKRGRTPSSENLRDVLSEMGLEYTDVFGDGTDTEIDVSWPRVVTIGREEYLPIQRYDARLAAGPGCIIDPNAEPLGYHMIERQWLRQFTLAAPEMLAVVRVDGNSMTPTFEDGDWVLVDRTQNRIGREGIYALDVRGNARIKRISLSVSNQMIRIISDNPVIPMDEASESDLHVIGRVVAIAARRVP